ncbi:hypothetical protein [Streptomyces sp. NPDC048196]|uniref:hypothetical protein n=1 Tax=Streptomyces sp. NPDC048196 TaxID=3154712 RepID=UPI00340A2416
MPPYLAAPPPARRERLPTAATTSVHPAPDLHRPTAGPARGHPLQSPRMINFRCAGSRCTHRSRHRHPAGSGITHDVRKRAAELPRIRDRVSSGASRAMRSATRRGARDFVAATARQVR